MSRSHFNYWMSANGGEKLISTATRVWDEDLNAIREKLYELYEHGVKVGQTNIEIERAKVAGLTHALQAKQNIQVGLFSIFKRTPTNDRP